MFVVSSAITVVFAMAAHGASPTVDVSLATLEDKIRGGLLAEILGNLNGLPHEMKYIGRPGNVLTYTPDLPDGAFTDDDTDIEWAYLYTMQENDQILLPRDRIVEVWRKHINRGIYCANLYARKLMELGIEPPLTGNVIINPWSDFNISGQFLCEAFGLISPGLPRTAARIGLHYTHVAIEGEPAQTTQMFGAMIATAFFENDINRIIDAGLASADPKSTIYRVVTETRRWHAANPKDWRKTRSEIDAAYTRHKGAMRDRNGYELNTASTIASLLYGAGDLTETLRTAFNFGWDADNNAATSATIIGVIRGRRWMDAQGWKIGDAYKNKTRDAMPDDETITRYGDRLVALARKVIAEAGGKQYSKDGQVWLTIPVESPGLVEALGSPMDAKSRLTSELLPRIEADLADGDARRRASAAYLAICLDQAERLRAARSTEWADAIDALKNTRGLMYALYEKTASPVGDDLRRRAAAVGLEPPPRLSAGSKPAQ